MLNMLIRRCRYLAGTQEQNRQPIFSRRNRRNEFPEGTAAPSIRRPRKKEKQRENSRVRNRNARVRQRYHAAKAEYRELARDLARSSASCARFRAVTSVSLIGGSITEGNVLARVVYYRKMHEVINKSGNAAGNLSGRASRLRGKRGRTAKLVARRLAPNYRGVCIHKTNDKRRA